MKKAWERPELLVLIRGKREEGVLIYCKTIETTGANNTDNACGWEEGNGGCSACDNIGST